MRRAILALMVVLAAGPALAVGATTGQPADAHHTATSVTAQDLECGYPLELTEADGDTVTIEEEPEEVVALGSSDAQVMWEIGAKDKVTGMPKTASTEYLEDREDIEDVSEEGFSAFPEPEKIIDLEPDLVIAASVIPPGDIDTLRESGLTVYHFSNEQSLDDVYAYIEQIGQLVGQCEEAQNEVDGMQETVSTIEEAVGDEEPVSVYYAQGGGFTPGANTVENHMIRVAGGEDIAESHVDFYGEINEETVIAEDPEWLVLAEGMDIPAEATETTAAQEDQIVRVDPNAINQPGPRMIEPIQAMANAFYPEAMEETDMETENGTENGGDTGEDADDNGAGFTVIAGAVALAALVAAARRQ